MKIIFLDIDGVLNSETDFIEAAMYGHDNNAIRRLTKSGREVITPVCRGKLALLELIIKQTDAKIVITSTWREHLKLNEIYDIFVAQGFRLPRTTIIGKTEDSVKRLSSDHTYSRCAEITKWLDGRDNIESYVILDDISPHMFHKHEDNLVTTSEYDGLNKLHTTQAMNILGRNEEAQAKWDEYTRSLDLMISCMC